MIDQILSRASLVLAVAGGVMLCVVIAITCLSVLGRATGFGSVFGDVELTQAGVACAVFCFLPWCHMASGHASVDVFASRFPAAFSRVLVRITALAFAATMALIAVQLWAGMLSKAKSGQTTFLIEFPVWWAYAACLPGAVLAAAVALYLATQRHPA